MYLYKKEMFDNFRFKFNGLDSVEQNYSQCFQDLFVLSALDGKKKGSFLEVGAFNVSFLSNTNLLEREFDWSGIAIDIDSSISASFSISRPKTKFIVSDALVLNYEELLFDYQRIDYLSLDIEPSSQTLSCLKKLPLDKVRFSVITYETDVYDPLTNKEVSESIRKESRDILESKGYILVSGNISNLTDDAPFEDWYLDGTYFSKDIIDKFMRNNDVPLASHKYMLMG